MPTEALRLPRPLVNQLLRHAQRAAEHSQGWVLRNAHGELQAVPLAPETDLTTAAASTVFALYRSFKAHHLPLSADEIAALAERTRLYIEMALDTKGVLQLRAWRLESRQATPLEVAITDSEDCTPTPE